MQDEKVDFTRVCNLKIGDMFLENGIWKKVFFINPKVVKFKAANGNSKNVSSKGKKSQQFVQVARDKQD